MDRLSQMVAILVPLLIIMDPVGNLPFFLLFTEHDSPAERRRIAAESALIAFAILVFFALTGDRVLRFFGIELPAFQIAGGFIFFVYALQMLRLIPSGIKTTGPEEREGVKKENVALVPLGTPLLAGPGAITAVLVHQQEHPMASDPLILLGAIFAACLTTFIIFNFAQAIRRFAGVGGIRVIERIMGLLLAVIAVQFMVTGLVQILVFAFS